MTERPVVYQGIHRAAPGSAVPTRENIAMLDHWAAVIFRAWQPHHNEREGGVLLISPTDDRVARCLWMPHEAFLKALDDSGTPRHAPHDRPASEVVGSTTGKPGDVMWVLLQDMRAHVIRVWSVEWPFDLPGPMVGGGTT